MKKSQRLSSPRLKSARLGRPSMEMDSSEGPTSTFPMATITFDPTKYYLAEIPRRRVTSDDTKAKQRASAIQRWEDRREAERLGITTDQVAERRKKRQKQDNKTKTAA